MMAFSIIDNNNWIPAFAGMTLLAGMMSNARMTLLARVTSNSRMMLLARMASNTRMTLLEDFNERFFRHSRAGGNPVQLIAAQSFSIHTNIQSFVAKKHAKTYAALFLSKNFVIGLPEADAVLVNDNAGSVRVVF